MLSTAQAEGYVQTGNSGSVLEEVLDSLQVMPVELRRYLALIRDLDATCVADAKRLDIVQKNYLNKVRAAFKSDYSNGNTDAQESGQGENSMNTFEGRQEKLARIEPELRQEIDELRRRLHQKSDEKLSIAEQLHATNEAVLRKLDTDTANLAQLLKKTGEMGQGSLINEGDLVASCTSSATNNTQESNWILARVVSHSPLTPDRVVVADVDNNTKKHPLKMKNIVLLPPEDETLLEAKQRLAGVKAKSVMAMYPETTSFYKGSLVGVPYKLVGAQAVGSMADKVGCSIRFLDDEDAFGNVPKRVVPSHFVFSTHGSARSADHSASSSSRRK